MGWEIVAIGWEVVAVIILVLVSGAGLTDWNEDIFFINKKNSRK